MNLLSKSNELITTSQEGLTLPATIQRIRELKMSSASDINLKDLSLVPSTA